MVNPVKPATLEAQLTAVTQEFVARIVSILRGASIDDVARLGSDDGPRVAPRVATAAPLHAPAAPAAPARVSAARAQAAAASLPTAAERGDGSTGGRRKVTAKSVEALNAQSRARTREERPRQTAEVRAELADRIVSTLRAATSPMNARTLSSEMGVPIDLLTVPLLELRTEGRVSKHGEKRSTTYSVRE